MASHDPSGPFQCYIIEDPKVKNLFQTTKSNKESLCNVCKDEYEIKCYDPLYPADMIFSAAWYGHLNYFNKYLINIDPKKRNRTLRRCLQNAAWRGHLELVQHIQTLTQNPEQDQRDIVAFAALGGHLSILQYAKENEYIYSFKAFYWAAFQGDWPTFSFLQTHFTKLGCPDINSILEYILYDSMRKTDRTTISTYLNYLEAEIPHPAKDDCIVYTSIPIRSTMSERFYFIQKLIEKKETTDLINKLFYLINRCYFNEVNWNDIWWVFFLRRHSTLCAKYFLINAEYVKQKERVREEKMILEENLKLPRDLIYYCIGLYL